MKIFKWLPHLINGHKWTWNDNGKQCYLLNGNPPKHAVCVICDTQYKGNN